MSHKSKIRDTETHFIINPATRIVTNESASNNTIVQYDHNSERFTFKIPRYVDGHDMYESTEVRIHYRNGSSNSLSKTNGLYIPNDLAIDEGDDELLTFSWLLSSATTQYIGFLHFSIQFICLGEDGETIEYAWNTGVYKDIRVIESINNAEEIVVENADAILALRKELLESVGQGGSGEILKTYTMTTEERCDEGFRRSVLGGTSVFDTTMNKPFWLGEGRCWYDAMGATTDTPLIDYSDYDTVNFGDSIFGKYQDNTSISAKLATLTGTNVMNAGLGGTALTGAASAWGQFALEKVVDALYADRVEGDNKATWNSLIKQAGGIIAEDGSVTHPTSNVFVDGYTYGILTLDGVNKGKVKNPQTGEYYDTNTIYYDLDNQTVTRNGVVKENAVTKSNDVITAVTKTISVPSYFSQTLTNLRNVDFSTVKHITFNQGTNDFGRNIAIDDYKAASLRVIDKLKAACPDAQITIIGIINRFDDRTNPENDATTLTNNNGDTLKEFMDAQKQIATQASVGYIEMFESLIDDFNKETVSQYYADSTHPNEAGNTIIAEYLANTGVFGEVVATPPTDVDLVEVTFVVAPTDVDDGTAITGAYVYTATMVKDADGNAVADGEPYEVGRDNIGHMPIGTYSLVIKADGYDDKVWAECAILKSTTKTLPTFVMRKASGDSGDTPTDPDAVAVTFVVNATDKDDGTPITDAYVYTATMIKDGNGNTVTDGATYEVGRDNVGYMPIGTYSLVVKADGYADKSWAECAVLKSQTKTLNGLAFTKASGDGGDTPTEPDTPTATIILQPMRRLRTIDSETGEVIASSDNADNQSVPDGSNLVFKTITDPDGTIQTPDQDGIYHLPADGDNPVTYNFTVGHTESETAKIYKDRTSTFVVRKADVTRGELIVKPVMTPQMARLLVRAFTAEGDYLGVANIKSVGWVNDPSNGLDGSYTNEHGWNCVAGEYWLENGHFDIQIDDLGGHTPFFEYDVHVTNTDISNGYVVLDAEMRSQTA